MRRALARHVQAVRRLQAACSQMQRALKVVLLELVARSRQYANLFLRVFQRDSERRFSLCRS